MRRNIHHCEPITIPGIINNNSKIDIINEARKTLIDIEEKKKFDSGRNCVSFFNKFIKAREADMGCDWTHTVTIDDVTSVINVEKKDMKMFRRFYSAAIHQVNMMRNEAIVRNARYDFICNTKDFFDTPVSNNNQQESNEQQTTNEHQLHNDQQSMEIEQLNQNINNNSQQQSNQHLPSSQLDKKKVTEILKIIKERKNVKKGKNLESTIPTIEVKEKCQEICPITIIFDLIEATIHFSKKKETRNEKPEENYLSNKYFSNDVVENLINIYNNILLKYVNINSIDDLKAYVFLSNNRKILQIQYPKINLHLKTQSTLLSIFTQQIAMYVILPDEDPSIATNSKSFNECLVNNAEDIEESVYENIMNDIGINLNSKKPNSYGYNRPPTVVHSRKNQIIDSIDPRESMQMWEKILIKKHFNYTHRLLPLYGSFLITDKIIPELPERYSQTYFEDPEVDVVFQDFENEEKELVFRKWFNQNYRKPIITKIPLKFRTIYYPDRETLSDMKMEKLFENYLMMSDSISNDNSNLYIRNMLNIMISCDFDNDHDHDNSDNIYEPYNFTYINGKKYNLEKELDFSNDFCVIKEDYAKIITHRLVNDLCFYSYKTPKGGYENIISQELQFYINQQNVQKVNQKITESITEISTSKKYKNKIYDYTDNVSMLDFEPEGNEYEEEYQDETDWKKFNGRKVSLRKYIEACDLMDILLPKYNQVLKNPSITILVCRALVNISRDLFEYWCEVIGIKSKDRFYIDTTNDYGIADIDFITKQYAQIDYEFRKAELIIAMIRTTSYTKTDDSIAEVIWEYSKYTYKVSGSTWYYFKNHRWIPSVGSKAPQELYETIKEEIAHLYNDVRDMIKASIDNENDGRLKVLADIIKSLKNSSPRNKIIESISIIPSCRDDNFEKTMNKKIYLIGFKDGIFDLESMKFRIAVPGDRVTYSTGYNFLLSAEEKKNFPIIVQEIEDFYKKVQPDPIMREYLHTVSAMSMSGSNEEQKAFIHTGWQANGKTTHTDAQKGMYGDYYRPVNIKTFMGSNRDGSSAQPDLADKFDIRYCSVDEGTKSQKLDASFFKNILSDEVGARDLYKGYTYGKFQPTFHFNANDIPKIDPTDSVMRRIDIIYWPAYFVDDPRYEKLPLKYKNHPYVYKKIKDMPKRVSRWKGFLFRYYLPYYYNYKKYGLITPEKVKQATEKYKRNCDIYYDYISMCLVPTAGAKISIETLSQDFTNWNRLFRNGISSEINAKNLIDYLKTELNAKVTGSTLYGYDFAKNLENDELDNEKYFAQNNNFKGNEMKGNNEMKRNNFVSVK